MKKILPVFLWVLFCFNSIGFGLEFKPNIDGFKEWKIGNKYVSASDEARKHVQDHPFYRALPQDFTEGSLYWRERLQLKIDGRLDKNLFVRYDIEEETDMPSKHDIYVKFYNHEFTFGDFEPEVKGGPFATINKKINGFMYSDKEESYNVFATLGEERSDTDLFIVNGDGSKKIFTLRYNPIVEGSLKVYVNDEKLPEGKSYSVNYTNYTVTLEDAYTVRDVIKFVYDYTNPVEDFISIDRQQFKAARVSFMMDAETEAIRVEVKMKENIDIQGKIQQIEDRKQKQAKDAEAIRNKMLLMTLLQIPVVNIENLSEIKPVSENSLVLSSLDSATPNSVMESKSVTIAPIVQTTAITPDAEVIVSDSSLLIDDNSFKLKNRFILTNSEFIELNGKKIAPRDYYLDYESGILKLAPKQWNESDKLKIAYSYFEYSTADETFIGAGTIGPYMMKHKDIIKGYARVFLNKHKLRNDEDYRIDWAKGEITFRRPLLASDTIDIVYLYYKNVIPALKTPKYNWFSGGATYLQKRAKSKDSTITVGVDGEEQTPVSESDFFNKVVVYKSFNWPMKEDTFRFSINGQEVSLNSVSVNYDNGSITVDYKVAKYINNSTANLSTIDINNALVKLTYQYYKAKGPLTYSFSGTSVSEPWNSPKDNRTGAKFISPVSNHIKMDRESSQIVVRLKHGIGDYKLLTIGEDYELVYEPDTLGRYSGQIGVIIYKPYTNITNYGVDLKSDDVIEVRYYYVITDAADPGYFQHDIVAVDTHFNFNEKIKLNADVAYSSKEYERNTESNVIGASVNATGEYNKLYQLPNQDIVKGSEYFTIRGIKRGDLEPGRNYYINYATGELKFIGFAPTKEDDVMVFYDYYTTDATASKKRKIDTGVAARIDSSYKDERLEVGGEYISIDRSFKPYTGAKALTVPVGSTQWAATTRYKVIDSSEVFIEKRQTRTQVDIQGDIPIYLLSDSAKYGATTRPFDWLAIDGYQNNINDVTDRLLIPTITQNAHTVDNRTRERAVKVTAGTEKFVTKLKYNDTVSEYDYLDRYLPQTRCSKIWEVNNIYAPIANLNFNTDYGYTDVYTSDDNAHRYLNSEQRRYYGVVMRSDWFSSLYLDCNFKITDVDVVTSYNMLGEPVSANRDLYTLKDSSYGLRYEPNWNVDALRSLELKFQQNHAESDGIALAQKGKVSNIKAYGVSVIPYGIRSRYQGNAAESIESNGNKQSDSNSNTYGISSYSPISWLSLNNVTFRDSQSNMRDLINPSVSQNILNTKTTGVNSSVGFSPIPGLRYTNTYSKDDNREINTQIKETSSNVRVTDRPKDTLRHEVTYSLPEVNLATLLGAQVGGAVTLGLSDLLFLSDRAEEQSIVNIAEYPSQDITVTPGISLSRGVTKRTEEKYVYNSNPFKWVKSTYLSDLIYNFGITPKTDKTNDTVSNTDLTRKLTLQAPILSNLSLETSWSGDDRKEFQNVATTRDLGENSLLNDYTKKVLIKKGEYLLGAKWAGFLYSDWKLNGVITQADQREMYLLVPSMNNTVAYKVYTLSPGLTLYGDRLIYNYFSFNPGRLEFSYQHFFDFIYRDGFASAKGFRYTLAVDWVPFQTGNIKGTATYKRNAVWGDNTNEAQQQKDISAGYNAGTTQISRQNYIEQEGKVDLEILVPISGLMVREVLNNVKINLSAILVEAKDHMNPTSDKNYYLWSLLGKFAVNF